MKRNPLPLSKSKQIHQNLCGKNKKRYLTALFINV